MSLPLSYPGLRCILENLEAVKRAHIVGHSPGLQKVDKLISLRLKDFLIHRNELNVNNLMIICDKDEVIFKMNGKTFSRHVSESQEDKMKKLINFYIYGRSIIHLGSLDWGQSLLADFLPVGTKFRVNSLTAPPWQFDTLLPFIDSRSFPLKTMATISKPSIFDSHMATTAETLTLLSCFSVTITFEELKKLNNKRVEFERFRYSKIDIIPLIKYQIETKKTTGTTFVIATDDKDFISEKLREFEQAFGEYRSDLDDLDERFLPGSSKFSIPINIDSKIQVYAIEEPEEDGPYKIIVKPVLAL
ncbi:hypothetical protein GCK72_007895 [Caenorhabditis remanei]|uniref:DUF38 domain-containing protein n=1 Tax=Caenorhabditis remanei TaxID=31234 RepID=A0A6A5HK88_CAERE|nr:hypothetical protein GCK72_007895 [Caenorhabditis remanei]KAF1767935.1 hypothetical protein GCK72_007895 [Caenorhabditis remanei]